MCRIISLLERVIAITSNQCKLPLYTPGHLQIVWDVFAKKSADIMSFRNSFITISTYTTIQKYHKTTALFCLLFLLFYSDRYWIHLLQNYDKNVWYTLMLRLVSSIFQIANFLVHPNFDLVSSLLALFAARKVVQMTTEMIECYHLRQHFTHSM